MHSSKLRVNTDRGGAEAAENDDRNNETTATMDAISTLSDAMLCQILSFLPTRESVATAVLSRRWRHLWKDLQAFDFSDDPFYQRFSDPHEASRSFMAFVNAILSQRRATTTRFTLSSHLHDENTFKDWIHAVTGPHLQELHLSLTPYSKVFRLPSVFNCRSLVSLTLAGNIQLSHRSKVHLPSLKTLELDLVTVTPIEKLLSASPVLETLKLTLDDSILVHAPPLVNRSLLVSDFPSLVEARLCVHKSEVHIAWLPKLLRSLRKAKLLVLEAETIRCLRSARAPDIPDFNSLLHLQLDFGSFNSRFLVDLLYSCHVLQFLVICNDKGRWPKRSHWTQPTSVPNCVMSHLSVVEFKNYDDSDDERAFVEYILERGLVLKTLAIHTRKSCQEKNESILKKLSRDVPAMPRGSDLCQLELD